MGVVSIFGVLNDRLYPFLGKGFFSSKSKYTTLHSWLILCPSQLNPFAAARPRCMRTRVLPAFDEPEMYHLTSLHEDMVSISTGGRVEGLVASAMTWNRSINSGAGNGSILIAFNSMAGIGF